MSREAHVRICGGRRVRFPPATRRRLRPLGIAALEDKVLQRAVVEVLNAVSEADFLGFSYGFRPGRSQHQALDALATGIGRRKVSWVLDADLRGYFDSIDRSWMVRFLEHRIADQESPAPDPEVDGRRSDRGRDWTATTEGTVQRGVGFTVALERLPPLRVRPLGRPVEASASTRRDDHRALR